MLEYTLSRGDALMTAEQTTLNEQAERLYG
jgi:hypothetical protein